MGRSVLRLVGADDAPKAQPLQERNANVRQARHEVAAENRLAASLAPSDARWALAVHTSRQLQGGQAAVLSPDARRRIVRLATQMGLRPFDANLVMAIVQDGARSGAGSLSPEVEERLTLVRAPGPDRRSMPWWPLVSALALALMLIIAGVRWLLG